MDTEFEKLMSCANASLQIILGQLNQHVIDNTVRQWRTRFDACVRLKVAALKTRGTNN
jgi:hypothetical protein